MNHLMNPGDYKFKYSECDSVYVGQTGTRLNCASKNT